MFAAALRRGAGAVARDRPATASIFDICRVATTAASQSSVGGSVGMREAGLIWASVGWLLLTVSLR